MKRCTKCGEKKPLDQFNRNKRTPDGLQYHCRACKAAYDRKYNQEHSAGRTAATLAWRAANPDRIKRSSPDKEREIVRRWQRQHPQAMREAAHRWRQNNPASNKRMQHRKRIRRLGQTGEVFTAQEWTDLCAEYDNRCCACGSDEPLTVDHVIPVIRNGPTTIDNIQPLCMACNQRKGRRIIDYRRKKQE